MDKETLDKINSEVTELGRNLRKEINDNEIAQTRKAILELVEALAHVAHGAPHLSAEDQTRIKRLLGIG